jgi:dihydropteroate synthase
MGVVNVTPDSFSDGGRFVDPQAAYDHGLRLIDEGADILDVGGQSTAPDSGTVSTDEECRRVLPVVSKLAAEGACVSVDTFKAEVARRSLDAGALMVNDVTALRGDEAMCSALANADCRVVLMYSKDRTARTTMGAPHYDDVVPEVCRFLRSRIELAVANGIDQGRIVVDPGMGAFVSTDPRMSLDILRRLDLVLDVGCPVLVGASRKGFIGKVLDLGVDERLEGSLACAAVAAWNGARIVRVHDVLETVRVVKMVDAIAGKT